MEVCNLIEVFDNNGKVDRAFVNQRVQAYKTMYTTLDVIGWYQSTKGAGDKPNKDDFKFATQVLQEWCGQNHLLFQCNLASQAATDNKALPLFCYEVQKEDFAQLDFKLASSDAEQIAVDDIYMAVDPNSKVSTIAENLKAPLNAIKLLRAKLNFLIKAVESSEEVRKNHDFMRRLNQIVNQTPIATKKYYDQQVLSDYSEAQLLNLMSEVMHSETQIQSLIETFNS
jgi:hypothetical protein